MTATTALSAAGQAQALAAAHARLLADRSFQFSFAKPRPPPPPPEWLKALGRFLSSATTHLPWLLWALLAVGVVAIVALVVRELVLYRRPGKAKAMPVTLHDDWRPAAARAKVLLADADRLAAEGRYDEAAHLLLWRSIHDIEEKRPHLVAPAHTSRDIAVLSSLPGAARAALEIIVRHVEQSLFGGRGLDASTFAECRRAYEAFAFPGQWASGDAAR